MRRKMPAAASSFQSMTKTENNNNINKGNIQSEKVKKLTDSANSLKLIFLQRDSIASLYRPTDQNSQQNIYFCFPRKAGSFFRA